MAGSTQAVEPPLLSKEFAFVGDFDSMPAARDSVMDFLRPYCSDEAEEIDVLLALQEALANAILHGCKGSTDPTVYCRVEIDPSAFTIVVRDSGAGFNHEVVSDSSEPGFNLSEHGRGISLMRSLMDEVSYHQGGTEVRMRKLRGISHSAAVVG